MRRPLLVRPRRLLLDSASQESEWMAQNESSVGRDRPLTRAEKLERKRLRKLARKRARRLARKRKSKDATKGGLLLWRGRKGTNRARSRP